MIIPLQNALTIVQRIQVIWIFAFQRNFSFGAVHSADEKHLSTQQIVMLLVYSQILRNAKLGSVLLNAGPALEVAGPN